MNPHLHQYVKDIDRGFIQYRKEQETIADKLVDTIKYKVTDIVDYIIQAYPFKNDYGTQLKNTVFFQLDLVLVRRRDFSHQAIQDLRNHANIDWFAEPFFGARKLRLSTLLSEYDTYRYNRTYRTSSDCAAYMMLDNDHEDDCGPDCGPETERSQHSATTRESPFAGQPSPAESQHSEQHSEQHYKRMRKE